MIGPHFWTLIAINEGLLWVESGRSRMSIVAARCLARVKGGLAIDQVNKSACSVTSSPKAGKVTSQKGSSAERQGGAYRLSKTARELLGFTGRKSPKIANAYKTASTHRPLVARPEVDFPRYCCITGGKELMLGFCWSFRSRHHRPDRSMRPQRKHHPGRTKEPCEALL